MGEDTQVLVRFVTKLPAELRVPQAEVVRFGREGGRARDGPRGGASA